MDYNLGVNIVEGTPPSPVVGLSTAISGMIGVFERGPVNEIFTVGSMAEFTKLCGTVVPAGSTSWYSVKAFFMKVGAAPLNIVRIASSSAAKAGVTLQDRLGTPTNTLKIEGLSEGTWGNRLSVEISNYNILSTTLSANVAIAATSAILVSIGGLEVGSDVEFNNGINQEQVRIIQIDASTKTIHWTGGLTNAYTIANGSCKSLEFSIKVNDNGLLIETWDGLSMNDNVTFFCEKKVVSDNIIVTDLKTVDTDYQDLPAVTSSAQPLISGNDGLSNIVASDYIGIQANKTGKYAFDAVPGLFRFCCPNPVLTDADVDTAYEGLVQDLLDYASNRVKCMFYADVPYNKSVADTITFGNKFEGRHLFICNNWGKVTENSLEVVVPPSSADMAAAVAKDYKIGVHKNVGNERISYFQDINYHLSETELNSLNEANINSLHIPFAGSGIRIYGGRTKSALIGWRFVNYSEYWNYVAGSLEISTQDVVFQPHEPRLWKTIERRLSAFFEKETLKGAITEFVVLMDKTNNPQTEVAKGIGVAQVEYVPVGTLEKFVIGLTSSPSGLTAK